MSTTDRPTAQPADDPPGSIPPYGERDLELARRTLGLAGIFDSPTLREVAGEIARARAEGRREGGEAALAPFEALFAGGPDTSVRTTWLHGPHADPELRGTAVECVEVPLDDLRGTFDEAHRIARGEA